MTTKIKIYKDLNLKIIFLITLMAVLGVASITPALPVIEKHFDIPKQQIGWLITVFTLPGVALTPVIGILADRYGRKRILIPALFLFSIAGSACFFMNNFVGLLFLRFLQGAGSSALGSLNVTLIGDIYSGQKRAEAMGYNSSILSVGTALYPGIGGILAMAGWNFPFLLPLLGLPIAFLTISKLNTQEPITRQRFKDYILQTGKHISNMHIISLFLISIITFIMLYGAFLTYFPFLLTSKFNANPFIIGILMSVMSISTAIMSSRLGQIVKRINGRLILIIAFGLYATALFIVPFVNKLAILVIPVAIYGIAQGMNIPNIYNMVANYAPEQQRAAFMSLNATLLRLGQTVGPLLAGLCFAWEGLQGIYFISAGIAVLMIAVIWLFVNKS